MILDLATGFITGVITGVISGWVARTARALLVLRHGKEQQRKGRERDKGDALPTGRKTPHGSPPPPPNEETILWCVLGAFILLASWVVALWLKAHGG